MLTARVPTGVAGTVLAAGLVLLLCSAHFGLWARAASRGRR
jgi:hypothetical protein